MKTIQKMKQHMRGVALLAMIVAAAVSLHTSSVQAAENTANTLKVSPVRSDIEVKPGESKTVKTIVTNLTDAPITVRPITNDFVSGDERGTPALILDADKYAPTRSLKRYMGELKDVTIPAKKSQSVDVVITIPKDARAGGYFGAVRFAPTTPDSGGQVNLSASVASLILVSVPGNVTEKLSLTDFDIKHNGATGRFFTDPKGLEAAFRFQNSGDIQEGPFGKISVKQGDKVVFETDFNNKTPRDMILPDSARRWEVPLDKIGTFGKYEVFATFTYGKSNQTIEVSRSFWMIPWSVIIAAIVAVVVLLLVIGLVIWLAVKKRNNRKSHTNGRGR